jgi:hypothetical protein
MGPTNGAAASAAAAETAATTIISRPFARPSADEAVDRVNPAGVPGRPLVAADREHADEDEGHQLSGRA